MNAWCNLQAMYVLWLREMKRYLRARSRIIGSLGMPFFFLVFLGTGFKDFRPASIPERWITRIILLRECSPWCCSLAQCLQV